jgi:hypothetical protein
MKPWIRDDQVRRRVPQGRELPARFDAFLRAEPAFRVEWNNLALYGLKRTATREAVPFLRLPDGALVAFWYYAASPAVVLIGAHGELKVLARDFDDFLKAVGARCSGLSEFDEADPAFRVPGVSGKPHRRGLSGLQKEFDDWFKKHTSLQQPIETPEAEALRQRVHRITEDMIREGRSKVYSLSSPWWSIHVRIERHGRDLSIAYLDHGEWYPVPEKYGLVEEVLALLELVKHKDRKHYELCASSVGIVSIDRDRELVLVPPGFGAK